MARASGPPSSPGDYWVARTRGPHRASAMGCPCRAMTRGGSAKKWAGKPAQSIERLNHRKQRARSARTPGGWGAEESGAVADRALRDLRIASYRGAAWAELGPYYEVS